MTVGSLPARSAVRSNADFATWLAFLAIAMLSLVPILRTLSAAGFLCFGGLLVLSRPAQSIGAWVRWGVLLILPLYCVASTLWSPFPGDTLRYSIQLTLTLLFALVVAERIPPRTMLHGLFAVFCLVVVLSLLIGRNGSSSAWQGIYESKNAFAQNIALFSVISAAVMLDTQAPKWLRRSGLVALLISVPLLMRAQSVGALVVIGPAVFITFAAVQLRRLSALQRTFVLCLTLLGFAVAALAVVNYGDVLLSTLLESSGKDSTLTGRTDLWQVGLEIIGEHPLLGVGYRGFWVQGYGPAEQLWAMFGERSGAGFNFHDTYISNAVELGLVGAGIETLTLFGGLLLLAALVWLRPTATNAFLLGAQLLIVLRSFVEVEVFYEFSIPTILVTCNVIYAWRGLAEARRLRPPAWDRSRTAGQTLETSHA